MKTERPTSNIQLSTSKGRHRQHHLSLLSRLGEFEHLLHHLLHTLKYRPWPDVVHVAGGGDQAVLLFDDYAGRVGVDVLAAHGVDGVGGALVGADGELWAVLAEDPGGEDRGDAGEAYGLFGGVHVGDQALDVRVDGAGGALGGEIRK